MSRQSSRCLIMMTDSKIEKRVSSLAGSRTHHTTTSFSSNSINLQQLNDISIKDYSTFQVRQSNIKSKQTQKLRQTLKQKQQMARFYKTQLLRRKKRFQYQMFHKQKTLTETIQNLMNLVQMEVQKNRQIQKQINNHKQSIAIHKSIDDDSLLYLEQSEMIQDQDTMLLDEVQGQLEQYL